MLKHSPAFTLLVCLFFFALSFIIPHTHTHTHTSHTLLLPSFIAFFFFFSLFQARAFFTHQSFFTEKFPHTAHFAFLANVLLVFFFAFCLFVISFLSSKSSTSRFFLFQCFFTSIFSLVKRITNK